MLLIVHPRMPLVGALAEGGGVWTSVGAVNGAQVVGVGGDTCDSEK